MDAPSLLIVALSFALTFLVARVAGARWRARRRNRQAQAARAQESRQVRRARERQERLERREGLTRLRPGAGPSGRR